MKENYKKSQDKLKLKKLKEDKLLKLQTRRQENLKA